jgi:hypothetical protein
MPGPVTPYANAVASASNQLVITAGAHHVGALERNWPFIPANSQVIERKALSYIEGLFKKDPYIAPIGNEVDDLATYLALSTCCHVFDGWRYISQAAAALLNGARSECLHLAYYAELRAAASILAGSGIGILNRLHFALDDTGNVFWFKGSTHERAWEALKEWSTKADSAESVVRALGALGLQGDEWADVFGITASADVIAQTWISAWSIDLNTLTEDRNRRNEASYRPDLSRKALSALSELELKFIRSVNNSLEPMGEGKFNDLDMVIIYNLCKTAFMAQYSRASRGQRRKFWREVKRRLINNVGYSPEETAELINALRQARYSDGSDLLVIADAKNPKPSGVFCRALFLLRLASALLRRQWQEIRTLAGWSTGNNWQDSLLLSYSVSSHLWGEREAPDDYAILAEDQVLAQELLDGWLVGNKFNAYQLWREQPATLMNLCRLERVGVIAAALS